ncbi:MAG: hypothetical protein KGL37_01945 [Acidobacteriota bacterium]|nr:hypothetical protein [Acidobacteriota bacterium]
MQTYLFDASAAVQIYVPRKKTIRQSIEYVLKQKELGQAMLFIPNFCVAEVFNAFAKMHFRERRMGADEYKRSLKDFRDDIHWGKRLYAYDLNRYHIIAADKIIPAEQKRPLKPNKGPLSTFDILIISMACELAYTRGIENTFLLTDDERLHDVCDDLSKNVFHTPRGPLGELDDRRWISPKSFYLDRTLVEALQAAGGQPLAKH